MGIACFLLCYRNLNSIPSPSDVVKVEFQRYSARLLKCYWAPFYFLALMYNLISIPEIQTYHGILRWPLTTSQIHPIGRALILKNRFWCMKPGKSWIIVLLHQIKIENNKDSFFLNSVSGAIRHWQFRYVRVFVNSWVSFWRICYLIWTTRTWMPLIASKITSSVT